jgi:hypothetical protein
MLVKAVVVRKTAVQRSSRFPLRKPNITIKPDPIPTRLIRTCRKVKVAVLMPQIMTPLLSSKLIAYDL